MLTNVKTSENTRNFFLDSRATERKKDDIFYGNVMI